MLASLLKAMKTYNRREVGVLWASIVRAKPSTRDEVRGLLAQSDYARAVNWARMLQHAYLSGVSKGFDHARRDLTETERRYARREHLRTVTTPLNMPTLDGTLQLTLDTFADLPNQDDRRNLKDEMVSRSADLQTYMDREIRRLYGEGYVHTLERLGGDMKPRTSEETPIENEEPSAPDDTIANVFCPTGEGGGVDPTCSPSGTSSTKGKSTGGRVQRTNSLAHAAQVVFGDKLASRSGNKELTDDDIRAIGFSPEGTTVIADGRMGEISTYTQSDEKDEQGSPQLMASRTIRKPWFGPLTCYNNTVKVWGSFKGKGLELFDNQVRSLQALGVKRIVAHAAGDAESAKTDPKSGLGYYAWPRMGFSGIMKSSQIAKLPPEIQKALKGKRDVRDLFDLPGGAEVWKAHGGSIKVHFDLSPGSRNMRALEAYKEERAKRPTANIEEGGEFESDEQRRAFFAKLKSGTIGDEVHRGEKASGGEDKNMVGTKAKDVLDAVSRVYKGGQPSTAKIIAEELGIALQEARKVLKALAEQGKLRRKKVGFGKTSSIIYKPSSLEGE